MNSQLWANIFLGCFLFGFVLSVISLLFGFHHHGHFGGHDGFHAGHGGHGIGGHGHGHAAGHGDSGGDEFFRGFHLLRFLNINSIVMFVTWFGAAGYLLLTSGRATMATVFAGAITAGLIGGFIVFLFLYKFLAKAETRMDPTEYYFPGTLARVTSPIRAGGTGEIVYVHGGTRKTAGARSDEEAAHRQGDEVMIVRYEKGIAYVRSVGDKLSSGL
jgi:membrane protein implicated in regulation of membrane protease activity